MINLIKKWPVILLVILTAVIFAGCSSNTDTSSENDAAQQQSKELSGEVVIFHAGSLSVPFEQMEKEFEQLHPGVDVKREPAGSRACAKKITDLGKKADIMASADYTVIDNLLIPDYAGWNALFARNEMVIMYSEHSKYKDEINGDNWYKILLRNDVQYGHSDPNADPCGYRALMVWQLAEKHYQVPGLYQKLDAGCPKRNIRPKETDLIAMVESGALDYLFIYRSVAQQHNMPFVELPAEINLSDIKHADFYKQAVVETTGKKPGETITQVGKPIVYGVTLTNDPPNRENAVEFLKFLLDKEKGLKIMDQNGQPVIDPLVIKGKEAMPEELKEVIDN
ncbi:molybdate/tungstate transport system substrate-binding protein [Desulfohalotomaculum tongense]|uniref:tungstate ABC transporter substrate-binding protein WtpA n=1 Tax=Desulforadius tongensis TaxID=1216062 RepID=UPI00195C2F65|nr:tungstate ABC transporter substrate-binding protein WtpA [Desulforadius tongensis]MBM7853938.1 molybdate/tungstate transport system substrate-binding protein [Desulforadius tongensis]